MKNDRSRAGVEFQVWVDRWSFRVLKHVVRMWHVVRHVTKRATEVLTYLVLGLGLLILMLPVDRAGFGITLAPGRIEDGVAAILEDDCGCVINCVFLTMPDFWGISWRTDWFLFNMTTLFVGVAVGVFNEGDMSLTTPCFIERALDGDTESSLMMPDLLDMM